MISNIIFNSHHSKVKSQLQKTSNRNEIVSSNEVNTRLQHTDFINHGTLLPSGALTFNQIQLCVSILSGPELVGCIDSSCSSNHKVWRRI